MSIKLVPIEENFITREIRSAWKYTIKNDPPQNLNLGEIIEVPDDCKCNSAKDFYQSCQQWSD